MITWSLVLEDWREQITSKRLREGAGWKVTDQLSAVLGLW